MSASPVCEKEAPCTDAAALVQLNQLIYQLNQLIYQLNQLIHLIPNTFIKYVTADHAMKPHGKTRRLIGKISGKTQWNR